MLTARVDEVTKIAASSWAEVSLGNLQQNFWTMQQHVGKGVTVCAVVKTDAYGHGAVECSLALQRAGAKWLGVNSLSEAAPLREAGIDSRILLMTGFWRGEEEEIVRLRLTPMVWACWQVRLLENAAATLGVNGFAVHVKVDSGMGRLGVGLRDLPAVCSAFRSAPHLLFEGLSTHLASAEVLVGTSVEEQVARFEEARRILGKAGLEPALLHASNTSATIARTEAWYNMVRPGLGLYGYRLPFQGDGHVPHGGGLGLKPIMTWKTRVLTLREIDANLPLGYGGTFSTQRPSRIAVLPVGYADGLNRQLSSRGHVILRGQYAPIVGRISMNLTLVDVTDIPEVAIEDEVILHGSVGGLSVDALQHAELCNTIPQEILCAISKRVPRQYVS